MACDIFSICVSGIQNDGLRSRLQGIRQKVTDAETDFDSKCLSGEIHLIAEAAEIEGVAGNVSGREMERLYDRHLARQKSRGHAIYDKIMMAAPHRQCPFCGHLPVSTLDHTLPKTLHPALAVTPINLVPCCKDCNHNKGTLAPADPQAQFLNAYYDDISGDRWLFASIIESSPPAAIFFVDAPDHWDGVLAGRVERHFATLKLAELYASQAGRQLQNIRRALSNTYYADGAGAVYSDLLERSLSCADVTVNSWEGALYAAASENDWYCNGGFSN